MIAFTMSDLAYLFGVVLGLFCLLAGRKALSLKDASGNPAPRKERVGGVVFWLFWLAMIVVALAFAQK